jgi:dynactin 1
LQAETLQLELEAAREKIEELTLDLEIIKAEMSERAGGGSGESSVSTYEMKQLEQQNIRLRDTLVRLDMTCLSYKSQKSYWVML